MKQTRRSPGQTVAGLRKADALLGSGATQRQATRRAGSPFGSSTPNATIEAIDRFVPPDLF